MTVDIYQIDAFTNTLFGGNPAAVCQLKEWLPDATLASAYVILNCLNYNFNQVEFETMSGKLIVRKSETFLEMQLPSRPPELLKSLPKAISDALSLQPKEFYKSRDYVLVYESQEAIENLKVSASILEQIETSFAGIIVSAKGNNVDFVSRFFTPGAAVFEDPVTGSAHCTLVPFWAERLGKNQLVAHQISERHGELHCKLENQTVWIKGQAVKYLQGQIEI